MVIATSSTLVNSSDLTARLSWINWSNLGINPVFEKNFTAKLNRTNKMLLLKARTGNEIESGSSHSQRIAPIDLHPKPRATDSYNSSYHRDTSKQMNIKPLDHLSSTAQQYLCTTVDYGASATMPYYNDYYDGGEIANSMGLQNIQEGFQMARTKPK